MTARNSPPLKGVGGRKEGVAIQRLSKLLGSSTRNCQLKIGEEIGEGERTADDPKGSHSDLWGIRGW